MSKPEKSKGSVSQNQKVKEGEWEVLPYDSQIEAVHMALLITGKVLYYSGNREYEAIKTRTRLWDPKTGNIKDPTTPEDLFCAGHSTLPDGRLLSTGGTLETRVPIPAWLLRLARPIVEPIFVILQKYFGLRGRTMTGHTVLYIFDHKNENWESAGNMPEGRWYPTNTTLPNGKILILSGLNEGGGIGSKEEPKVNRRVEVYDADTGLKQVATIPEMKMDDQGDHEEMHHGFPSLYPRMYVFPLSEGEKKRYPAGKAFCSGYGPETKMLSLHTWEWEDIGKLKGGLRHDGCSVLLPLRPPGYRVKILTCGGSDEETGEVVKAKNSAEMIDFGEESPEWKMIDPMQDGRVHAGSVILPDGNVLIVGGNSTGMFRDPVYSVELFVTETERWKKVAPISVARGYHGTTVLLPDGRVLQSGTTPWGKEELRMEVYSPYYLFNGERPVITEVAQSISYGQSFQVGYSCETSSIKSAVLIRPGSMTHAFDMDQRYVQVEISDNADNRLTVKAPPDAHIAPPGYYMLFLLSDEGVPSEAKFIHLPIKR